MEQNVVTSAPVTPATSAVENKQKSGNGLKIATIIACIVAICGIGFGVYGMIQNAQKDEKIAGLQAQIDSLQEKSETIKPVDNDSLISNTTWTASDGSEVIFTDTRIDWYQNPNNHFDNYYSGVYKFYIGEEAVNYITQNLSEYGVTKSELASLFNRNNEYNEDNFVVFDIRYNKMVVDGYDQEITRPLIPWYGFILEDNTYLDVANMNTGTYYKFTKNK